mgnify:CR=1 FL=1
MTSTSSSEPDNDPAKAAAYIRLSTLGFQVVITFVVLALAGIWIDDQFDVHRGERSVESVLDS